MEVEMEHGPELLIVIVMAKLARFLVVEVLEVKHLELLIGLEDMAVQEEY